MQIGEVHPRSLRPNHWIDIRLELDQIAGHKSRGEPEPPHHLHKQPGGIAARSGAQRERLLGRLHTRLHANDVTDGVLQHHVQ